MGEEQHDLDGRLATVVSGFMFRGLQIKATNYNLSLTGAGLSQLGNLNK